MTMRFVKQRLMALFFITLLIAQMVGPGAVAWVSATSAPSAADISNAAKHKTSTVPSIGTINTNSPSVPTTLKSNKPAAADTATTNTVASSAQTFLGSLTGKVNNEALGTPDSSKKPIYTPHELIDLRSATSSSYLNSNGTVTKTNYFSPHFYQNNGSWTTINTALSADNNAADSGNILGKALGAVESWLPGTPNAYTVNGNSWQARFTPSNFDGGILRLRQGGSQVGFSPINANIVNPVVTTDSSGQQTIHYTNLWNGIDVTYMVKSDEVKEAIIIKDKTAASSVQFKVIGANLTKPATTSSPDTVQPAFTIQGALGGQFGITPANLILKDFGYIDESAAGLNQSFNNGIYTVGVSASYLQQLPAKAFPAVIDPSPYQSHFGSRQNGGNYVSFKTDGTICYSNVCDLYGGGLYDSNGYGQLWRGAFYAPYDVLRPSGITLANADLHLTQLTGVSWWTGNTGVSQFQVGHATCLNSFNCLDGYWNTTNIGTSGDFDVTSLYQNRIANGDWGAWLMVAGDESYSTFKSFDPDNSYVTFTYNYNIPPPSMATPTNGQVFVDPQASFAVNAESNPNNSSALQYEMMVSDAPGGVGTIIDSGTPQNSTLWTVPDGVLQDGSTYYIQARSFDSSLNIYSPWSGAVQFKIDSREGKDKTQTSDSFGPVSVDLATGNLSTSISSHTTKALAGNIGVNLSYNAPLKSRLGLVGSYWNVSSSNYSVPSRAPDLTRVDQNVNFDWSAGSPGTPINSTWFTTQWNGYFVAPQTGTYTFGGSNDDSMTVLVNNQQLYNQGCYGSSPCYGSTISMTAGQIVPIQVTYIQATGPDYAHLYVQTPDGASQVVPETWLQTGVRPMQQNNGLTGHYYNYTDNGNPPALPSGTTTGAFLTRTDPVIDFNWNSGSPIPNGSANNFEVQWSGYLTVPVNGSYTFGTTSDDGSIVTINGTQNLNAWHDQAPTTTWGSAVTLTAGQSVPITVDYYQHMGGDMMALIVQTTGGTSETVPSSWLSPGAQVLPAGWNLGVDPDGNGTYNYLTVNQNNAILTDSSGDTYDYTWNGTGYTPPTNSYGHLVRNVDGTYTLQDADGTTYVFSASGTLVSMTQPVDDAHPAALQYTYGSVYSGGPVEIQKITDGVTPSRYMNVYYSGASQCGTSPAGFAAAPANMICAAQTNDGRTTYFYYDSNGNLAEVAKPGNDDTLYQYQLVSNSAGQLVGYQLSGIRDDLANDTVVAGVRANDQTTYTQIGYDILGRATNVTEPAATAGASQLQNTIQYLPGTTGYQNGNPTSGYFGASQEHVAGAAEPNGYTERVEYDNLFRTTAQYDVQGLKTTTLWDAAKDLSYDTIAPTGLETSTIYDGNDRDVTQYGPAPSSWFQSTTNTTTGHTDITPTSSYTNQTARTDTSYDQGFTGLGVAYMAVNEGSTPNTASLTNRPLLHSTNIATDGTITKDFGSTSSPIPNVSTNWGFSMTGTMKLPTTGNWTFRIASDNGARMWIDNQVVIDDWQDGALRSHPTYVFNNVTAGSIHNVRIDYYHLTGDANFTLYMTPPSGSETNQGIAGYFSPNYGLETSTTGYDWTYGATTDGTAYGSNPELGLESSQTTDVGGANLTTTKAYEAPGSGFLRQTSQTSASGSTTNYTYYGANDTAVNPCTSGSTAAYQGGMVKTETDPGAANGSAGKTITTIYDDAGNAVATETNQDGWDCKTYDARERLIQEVIPATPGEASRTVTYNYNVGGNPLVTSETDNTGTITTTTDLLGRTVAYSNDFGDTTTTTYDNLGRISSETSVAGTTAYTYDNYNRQIDEQFNSVDMAQSSYDQYGRLSGVAYPEASPMALSVGYDPTTGNENSLSWTLKSGSVVTNNVTYSQSGKIVNNIVTAGSQSLWNSYTYDTAGRLTQALIGPHTYTYGFGAENASCAVGTNPNAGGTNNRTSFSLDGVATNYCYNYADQLVASSDATVNGAQYDAHGNMTQIGTGTSPLYLHYDSSDRNWGMDQYSSSGNGNAVYYGLDANGRITYRESDAISNWNWNLQGQEWYGYDSSSDTPDYVYNNAWAVAEDYLDLPGGVVATVRPLQTTQANKYIYDLPNIQGDTLLTTDGTGTNTSNGNGPVASFTYDPFGNPLPGSTNPQNLDYGSMGFEGKAQKFTETTITLNPIYMGARIYLPTLGIFTSMDPVVGGNANAYVYPADPVNGNDLTGDIGMYFTDTVSPSSRKLATKCMLNFWCSMVVLAPVPGGDEVKGGSILAKVLKSISPFHGKEFNINGFRVKPIGNWTAKAKGGGPNWAARLPHWHYKTPAWGATRHRPWQTTFRRWF